MQRDILIIGAGILGAATAFALARRGQGERVLVLDRRPPASGATSRAAALVTLARDKGHAIPLAQETYRAIATLENEFGEDVGRHGAGALHVAPAAQAGALRQLATQSAKHGIAHRSVDKDHVRALAPWLAPEAFDTALLFPQEAYVEPYLLCTAYLRAAARMGVAQRPASEVGRIRHALGRVTGVELAEGTILPATVVVNAGGPWAGLLAADLGIPLPMAPVRSQYWITAPGPTFPREGAIVLMPEIHAYARPEMGALLFGLRESRPALADPRQLPPDLAGFVFDPEDPEGWRNLTEGAAALGRYCPALETTGIAHYITGPSSYTPDGDLVVGPADHLAGLYFATGCNGGGIALSGGIGRLLAELIGGEAPFVDPAPHRPQRLGAFDPFAADFLAACANARAGKTTG